MLTTRAFWGDVLLGASDGTVYIGEADAVYRVTPGNNPEVLLRAAEPQAICEGGGRLIWIVLQDDVVRLKNGKLTRFAGPGKADQGISDCAIDRQGQIGLAAIRDDLFGRVGDQWRQIMAPPPESGLPPTTLLRNREQKLLVGFEEQSLGLLDPPQPVQFLIGPNSNLGKIRIFVEGPDGLLIGGRFGLGLWQRMTMAYGTARVRRSISISLQLSFSRNPFWRFACLARACCSGASTRSEFGIGDLPLYNEDSEAQAPPAWTRFRDAEVHRSMPGGLKNAIDVGSRPYGRSVFDGPVGAVISQTPARWANSRRSPH